jgi:hypothetical protein
VLLELNASERELWQEVLADLSEVEQTGTSSRRESLWDVAMREQADARDRYDKLMPKSLTEPDKNEVCSSELSNIAAETKPTVPAGLRRLPERIAQTFRR